MKDTAILWFRNDLRIHDNESLIKALKHADNVVPVFVFDERVLMGTTRYGFEKTGVFRCKFLIESVANLRKNLRSLGSDLYIRVGKPEEEVVEVVKEYNASWVFCNRERTDEEVKVQDRIEDQLWSIGAEIMYCRGKMLYNTSDLPFPITQTPDVFSQFRKEVEKYIPIRPPYPCPKEMPAVPADLDCGDVPNVEDFGHDASAIPIDHPFKGGEDHALQQLNYYLFETESISDYFNTRNGLLGWDFSTKFSAWLSCGALSPKKIYWEVKRYEKLKGSNKSTYWVFFELLWRDFFRLQGKKYRNDIFKVWGTSHEMNVPIKEDWTKFRIWSEGRTGIPFIDANMRELRQTGFMSNRGRQNVASFLVKDLKVNWLMGAEYFESLLIDYDPTSNYGNWNYVAGVGADPRENRYFNILSQAKRYDSKGEYVKHWLPELSNVPNDMVHRLDLMNDEMQQEYDVILGKDYPQAMVSIKKWAR